MWRRGKESGSFRGNDLQCSSKIGLLLLEGSVLEGGSLRNWNNCLLRQTGKKGPRASHGSGRSSGSGKIIDGKKS